MNDKTKAETDALWSELKPMLEPLTATFTRYYTAANTGRTCRHINELWHLDKPAVGLGFVPPEVRDQLESFIVLQGLHLHKANGPLGKAAYFSLLHDSQFTPQRITNLCDAIAKELQESSRNNTPIAVVKAELTPETIMETEQARMNGLPVQRADKPKSRPADVADLVDKFNDMAKNMTGTQALDLLANSIPYFSLPQDVIIELERALDLLRVTQPKA